MDKAKTAARGKASATTRATAQAKSGAAKKKPCVGIILGSDSDLPVMQECIDTLTHMGIASEVLVASAHRQPAKVHTWGSSAVDRGLKVIIAAAGKSAHLPGVVASLTPLPVIGVPMKTSDLGGLDSLLSIVQMPRGVPVATVAIDGAKNAAILAAQILGVWKQEYKVAVIQLKAEMAEK